MLLCSNNEGIILVYRYPELSIINEFVTYKGLRYPKFSPDGKYVATRGNNYKTTEIWEVSTGKKIVSIGPEKQSNNCHIEFTDDSKFFSTAQSTSIGYYIVIWDLEGNVVYKHKLPRAHLPGSLYLIEE